MGLFPTQAEQRAVPGPIDDFWYKLFPNQSTLSGVKVSESTMLSSSAVFACINVISQDIAQLPFVLYKRLKDKKGKEKATEHTLFPLLRFSPNPEMTAYSFKQTLQSHILGWGNAYANVERDRSNRIKALWILLPNNMKVTRENGELAYNYRLPNGQEVIMRKEDVLHIPGLSYNGIVGYAPITLMREALALSLAEEGYSARFFGNGAMPTHVMKHPGKIGDEGKKNIHKAWDKMHKGVQNSHRMAILEEGIDIQAIGLSQTDSQFLEGREFQINELARYFRMPLHKIQKMNDTSYNNIENMSQEYVSGTLQPHATQWEQSVHLTLLGRNEKSTYFAEFMFQDLLRGNSEARAKFYKSMWETGSLSPDDIRAMENLNPIPDGDGDQYFVPLNFIPIDKAGEDINPIKDTGANNTVDPDDNNDNEEEEETKILAVSKETQTLQEIRAQRTVKIRNRIRNAYYSLFKDAGTAIVAKETVFVRRAIKKYGNTDEFKKQLDKFYKNEIKKTIQKRFGAVLISYYDTLAPEVYIELNLDDGSIDGIEKFTQDYIDGYYNRHTGSSLGQINSILNPDKRLIRADNINDEDEDDEITALNTRMDEWDEKRGNKIAVAEIVQAEGALVVMMTLSQERTLIWQIQGKTTCEACISLQGKVVEKDQWFVQQNDDIPNGDLADIHVRFSKKHPPLHYACDCIVVPG